MKIKGVVCDWCGKQSGNNDYISVFRHDRDGRILGASDYCADCWNKYHHYPDNIGEKCIGVTCKTSKWYDDEHSTCIADYMTQHRCTYHSEWESKE